MGKVFRMCQLVSVIACLHALLLCEVMPKLYNQLQVDSLLLRNDIRALIITNLSEWSTLPNIGLTKLVGILQFDGLLMETEFTPPSSQLRKCLIRS